MKAKKIKKKLALNKTTVTDLNIKELIIIRGGTDTDIRITEKKKSNHPLTCCA